MPGKKGLLGATSSGGESSQAPPPSFEAAIRTPAVDPNGSLVAGSSSLGAFSTRFACLTFNMADRMRFIDFSPEDVIALRAVIQGAYSKGIQDVREYGGSTEIKFHGYPWVYSTPHDETRVVILRTLEALYNRGWVLQAPVDMGKKEADKDTLVFRLQSPPPPPSDWLFVSFDRLDRLRIVDMPPRDLTDAIQVALAKSIDKQTEAGRTFELKFQGYPWTPSGTDCVSTRLMLLRLLEVLEKFGFTMYGSIGCDGSSQADGLVMQRQKDWVPGMPIWHR